MFQLLALALGSQRSDLFKHPSPSSSSAGNSGKVYSKNRGIAAELALLRLLPIPECNPGISGWTPVPRQWSVINFSPSVAWGDTKLNCDKARCIMYILDFGSKVGFLQGGREVGSWKFRNFYHKNGKWKWQRRQRKLNDFWLPLGFYLFEFFYSTSSRPENILYSN